ncbi:hypothetical protein CSC35_1935 [Enterobacter hormaechei]|nr:hypothetical protein CSC35_1935 [Enterobacter hormaechei]
MLCYLAIVRHVIPRFIIVNRRIIYKVIASILEAMTYCIV